MSQLPCCTYVAINVTYAEYDLRRVARLLARKDTARTRALLEAALADRDRKRQFRDNHLATHDGAS